MWLKKPKFQNVSKNVRSQIQANLRGRTFGEGQPTRRRVQLKLMLICRGKSRYILSRQRIGKCTAHLGKVVGEAWAMRTSVALGPGHRPKPEQEEGRYNWNGGDSCPNSSHKKYNLSGGKPNKIMIKKYTQQSFDEKPVSQCTTVIKVDGKMGVTENRWNLVSLIFFNIPIKGAS